MIKLAQLPDYITIKIPCKIYGFNNIINLDYLIQKFNETKETYFKYVLEEGGYKQLVRKTLGKEIKKYNDYKRINEYTIVNKTYHIVYSITKDAFLAKTATLQVLWTLKGLNALKDKLRELGHYKESESIPTEHEVEFSYWNYIACIGAKEKGHKGNRKIKLRQDGHTLEILNPFGDRIIGSYRFEGKFGKILRSIFEHEIWRDQLGYFAKLIRLHENWKTETLHCQLHVTIPMDTYLKYAGLSVREPTLVTGYASGADVNSDRINVAVIRVKDLRLIDYKTFWYDEVNSKGFPHDEAWRIISRRLHEMYVWLRQKNSLYHVFEDYELIGEWKLINQLRGRKLKSSESNWRMVTFRSSVIEKAILIAIRENFPLPVLIDPSNTSQIAKELAPLIGLDIHTTSAYVITCLGILEQSN